MSERVHVAIVYTCFSNSGSYSNSAAFDSNSSYEEKKDIAHHLSSLPLPPSPFLTPSLPPSFSLTSEGPTALIGLFSLDLTPPLGGASAPLRRGCAIRFTA